MQSENLFKSWFTTLLGAGILLAASYELFLAEAPRLTKGETLWAAAGGFALMAMKDSISGWINQAVTGAIEKFTGKKDQNNPPQQ